jgi:predicted CopG family antitoxin
MMTTIQLEKETRESLKKYGWKGESYNDIIERLMDYCEELNIEEMIQERWERLQKEKDEYLTLDEI